ncbi:MAG TPA: acryloyl-CoA reductase [Planctomycetaceae bacterium]|nr:acryloyl-CoA reductase [Planctomycetaceae bacterium]HQZ67508.1 acryloyl-CoA reductase [Planctomycetaceae bacterium]
MLPETFRCYLVRQTGKDLTDAGVDSRPLRELPLGDVTICVERSSLNYKDAMAASGHPGIVRKFPHVPGIDAAGTVVESTNSAFKPGDQVLSTGHELGVERWGGWAEYIRVPAAWVLLLPAGLTIDEAMALGTAGFTAAQCVDALLRHGLEPDRGPIVVTGATGGVASLSIMILSQLGFRVVAVSGKSQQRDWLMNIGAEQVVPRDEFLNIPNRPLLSANYAGGVDTVGGTVLAAVLRMISHRGGVACCGIAGGAELQTTVYPFILRGISLAGIDSAWCPDDERRAIWEKLAGTWKPRFLMDAVRTVTLSEVGAISKDMLAGKTHGRTIIDVTSGGPSC